MNTEARDPILRGLDELAGLTDLVPVTDRMAGITRKARANRRRKVAAGVAGLAVIAAGAVGTAQLLSDGDASTGTGYCEGPDPPPATSGLTIDLTVDPIGPKTLGVTYRIHGTATAWSSPDDHQPMDVSGPHVHQHPARRPGGRRHRRWRHRVPSRRTRDRRSTRPGRARQSGMPVQVPGPGTYTVTVEAPYCGADGQVVDNEVSTTVTVPGD